MKKILAFREEDDEFIDVTIPALRNSVVFFTRSMMPKLVIPKITQSQKIFNIIEEVL